MYSVVIEKILRKGEMMTRYVSNVEAAKLVRKELKKTFPGMKFGVRSKGSDCIYIRWVDGPTTEAVKDLTAGFEGSGFDGMIDLEYNKTSWMLPSGEVGLAKTAGTTDSMGCHPAVEYAIPPGAELVEFMTKYIFTSREISKPNLEKARLKVCDYWGLEPGSYEIADDKWGRIPRDFIPNANEAFDRLVLKEAYTPDYYNNA